MTSTPAERDLIIPERPVFRPGWNVKILPGEGVLLHGGDESRLLGGTVFEQIARRLDGSISRDALVDELSREHPYTDVYFALYTLTSRGAIIDAGDALESNLDAALRALGLVPDAHGEVVLVEASNYLAPELADINRQFLSSAMPWLLCSAQGGSAWIGPLFIPGETACWDCLRHRLARNRPLDALLSESRPGVTASRRVAARDAMQVRETLLVMTGTERSGHRVQRRPQCAACGDSSLYARRLAQAPVLQPRHKRFTSDGGHRAATPDDVVARLLPLVDSLSGVVTTLERVDAGDPALHVYTAGINLARPAADVAGIRASLRRNTGGKGVSDVQARASALGEAVERYCGLHHGDEPVVYGTMEELGDSAIHPNAVALFSDRQLGESGRFRPDAPCDWTPVWSLTSDRLKYLPTHLLYYGHPAADASVFADSNGNAAGASLEDAILQGFFELVERDAAAIWWYNRVARPAIDIAAVPASLVDAYRQLGRSVWLLDLTSDFGIPVAAAISCNSEGSEILAGLGAHLEQRIAAERALTEMNQMLVAFAALRRDGSMDHSLGRWLTATLDEHPYLRPNAEEPRRYALPVHEDLLQDVQLCQRMVQARGLEMLVLDQTRPDVDVPVVKVIVPGLRHFRPRYACGRLYDVPVQLGWLDSPNAETGLNPVPFFL